VSILTLLEEGSGYMCAMKPDFTQWRHAKI